MSELPQLPFPEDDTQGVEAQAIVRTFAEQNPSEGTARALLSWLRAGGSHLMFQQYKLGVTAQTRKDIQNFRARLSMYEDWLDDRADGTQLVLGTVGAGDFGAVPDMLPNSPFKMPGIFDTALDGQTEVATLYRLSNAVQVQQDIWVEQLQALGSAIAESVKQIPGKAVDAIAPELETAAYVAGGILGAVVLYKVLSK